MAKKNRTPTEQRKYYRNVKNLCFCGEFVSVFAPFIAVGIANYEKYFVQYDGAKMSIFFVMALAVMGLATWMVAKKKWENTFITLILGWAVATFMVYILGELITDLAMIMAFGLIGILGACGLDFGSKAAAKKEKAILEAIAQANKDNTVEAYKQELKNKEEKKVKIKINKE